jgi:hypothetical protein
MFRQLSWEMVAKIDAERLKWRGAARRWYVLEHT